MISLPLESRTIFSNIISNNEINKLFDLFHNNKFEIRIAGGAVRDILLNITPHDIDFATNATPTEMKEIFEENNIRMINANGESHGTITARINDKENFEITTLRYDKVTDGRRAEVVFTKDWKIDAERRDLTINSMFLDKDELVYDYFNGIPDIHSRTVRFVGDPKKRIQEDYLRILRYFRFYGRIAEKPDGHLDDTIDKIRENGPKLQQVSGERIWSELKKILIGKFACEIIDKMRECEILPFLGLPDDPSLIDFKKNYSIMSKNNSAPSVFLSDLFEHESELDTARKRLKISNDEFLCAQYILRNKTKLSDIKDKPLECGLEYFKNEFIMHVGDPPPQKLKMVYHEYLKYIDRLDIWESFNEWKPPKFPVNGNIVINKCGIKGKELGLAISFLKTKWAETHFTATAEDLVGNETFRKKFMKSR